MRSFAPPIALAFVFLVLAGVSRAQGTDIIRGHVLDTRGTPVSGVNIVATSARGGVQRTGRTNESGRFMITFQGAEGHYFLVFSAIGFAQRYVEVRRIADEDVLIADVRLQRLAVVLDTSFVVDTRRQRVGRSEGRRPDLGGTEQAAARADVSPDQQSDVNQLAATVPGAMLVLGVDGDPAGFSVLGLPSDQNTATLSGLPLAGDRIPRDANVFASLVTSPYDVSRGGFSGAQLNIQAAPGSNFIRRSSSLSLRPASFQATDATARALGQRYTDLSWGGIVSGPIVFDRAFYSLSYQVDRRINPLRTLLNTEPLGLRAVGVAADSAARLIDLLNGAGIPVMHNGRLPTHQLRDNAALFGTADVAGSTSGSGQAVNFTYNASWSRRSPSWQSASEVPARGAESSDWNAGVQLHHAAYLKGVVLSETAISATMGHDEEQPYLLLPAGNVLVQSRFADGATAIRRLSFGGNQETGAIGDASGVGVRHQLSWVSRNNSHRLKATAEAHRQGYLEERSDNLLGTYAYNSLADLESGRPASFSRSLVRQRRLGSEQFAAFSIGDSYRPSETFQLQYGVRVDANRFGERPPYNATVTEALGVRNDAVPNRLSVSPRIGFSWSYGAAPEIAAFEGAARIPRAVVRGGIGVFRNVPAPGLLSSALENTGLPGGVQQVWCVGDAVPVPDWTGFLADPTSIPTRCADGTAGGALSSTAPPVTLFASDFVAPRSIRGNLQWSGPVLGNRFSLTVEGVYSTNLNQRSFADLNFLPQPRFTLALEAGRPVFVEPTSVVAATGTVASKDSRVSPLFDHVTGLQSDLRSEGRQLKVTVSPARPGSLASWSASYVYGANREQFRGFTSAAGDPRDRSWSPGSYDWRHQLTLNLGVSVQDVVRLSGYLQLASGTPFTPGVNGDVNGDGFANDRAFVFDPSTLPNPAGAAMRALLEAGPRQVRECLSGQVGAVAARNSCRGPWTSTAYLALSLLPTKIGLSERVALSLAVGNPLGALDQLLHGPQRLRGWGERAIPDQTLLFVRGFDPATRSFVYDVNPRFGSTDPRFRVFRQPVALTLSARIDVGPSRERQTITQQLDQGRRTPGERLSEEWLRSMYQYALPNPISYLIRQGDTLGLTGQQADSLAAMNVGYVSALDSIWRDVTGDFASLPSNYDRGAAYGRYRRAREASVDQLIALAPRVNRLLTARQKRLLPPLVTSNLDARYLAAIRSGARGDSGAGVFTSGATGGWSDGTTVTRVNIIIRNNRP